MKHSTGEVDCRGFLESLPRDPAMAAPDEILAGLHRYVALVLKHAHSRRLVSLSQRSAGAIWSHIFDSLQALPILVEHGGPHIYDAGSGNGFPGIPLALALQHRSLSLIDRSQSKAEFLELAVASLRLENTEVICTDLTVALNAAPEDSIVTARALANPLVWSQLLKSITSKLTWIIFATGSNSQDWEELAGEFRYLAKGRFHYNLPDSKASRIIIEFTRM